MASGTPSAQVSIPLTGALPLPPLFSRYTTWRELISERQRTAGGGKIIRRPKIIRRRNNYPGRAQVGQKIDFFSPKKTHNSENCRTVPKIPYSIS